MKIDCISDYSDLNNKLSQIDEMTVCDEAQIMSIKNDQTKNKLKMVRLNLREKDE